MSTEFKHSCHECGGHIAYDESHAGLTINCPHCGRGTILPKVRLPAETDKPVANAAQAPAETKPSLWGARNVAVAMCLALVLVAAIVGARVVAKHRLVREERLKEELARSKVESERANAEAEKAKAEAELARLKAAEEERTRAAAQSAADADAAGKAKVEAEAAEAARLQAEKDTKAEEERKAKAKRNPAVWALWEEPDHDSIQMSAVRWSDATLHYKGNYVTAKYIEMPEWLRTAAQAKYKEDGEAKGLFREFEGQIFDLRTNPPGWFALPSAEVIQIVEDGYLLVDEASLGAYTGLTKAFKLKHTGLMRILNAGDRIQTTAKSVGTYTYETKGRDIKTVPVYDPGLPVGPLRDKVVSFRGGKPPTTTAKRSKPASNEPIGNGSGFFISEDGLFVSNAHVVEDSTSIEVRTAAGKKKATVLRIDKDKDLALLRVSVVRGTVSALNISTNAVVLGDEVFTIGYPLVELQGSRPKYTDGKISSMAGIRDDPAQMQISVPVQPGNSGGPLVDANGDVVGVVVARLNDLTTLEVSGSVPQNVNYAVKGQTLLSFLKQNRNLVPKLTLGSGPKRSRSDAIRAVEDASGLVLIY